MIIVVAVYDSQIPLIPKKLGNIKRNIGEIIALSSTIKKVAFFVFSIEFKKHRLNFATDTNINVHAYISIPVSK